MNTLPHETTASPLVNPFPSLIFPILRASPWKIHDKIPGKCARTRADELSVAVQRPSAYSRPFGTGAQGDRTKTVSPGVFEYSRDDPPSPVPDNIYHGFS